MTYGIDLYLEVFTSLQPFDAMAKIRTIKPEFFKHEELYEAEVKTGLPLRLAFAGLWCCCDREGRFKWKPRELKLDVIPFDDHDFSKILDALIDGGWVEKYTVEGRDYGFVISFETHQHINPRETKSVLPSPSLSTGSTTRQPRVNHASTTREGRAPHALQEGEGKGREIQNNLNPLVVEDIETRQPRDNDASTTRQPRDNDASTTRQPRDNDASTNTTGSGSPTPSSSNQENASTVQVNGVRMHAGVAAAALVLPLDELKTLALADNRFAMYTLQNLGIDPLNLPDLLEEFHKTCKQKLKFERTLADYTDHFGNWYPNYIASTAQRATKAAANQPTGPVVRPAATGAADRMTSSNKFASRENGATSGA